MGKLNHASERNRMVDTQIHNPYDSRPPVVDETVLRAMRKVPRHLFVPEDQQHLAYEDRPLPIGHGQTISQPYIVAIMTELLRLESEHRVLEVGTGSGYQAAVLAEIAIQVYSIEVVESLATLARTRLTDLGYGNVMVRAGDGYLGWPEHAPFDAIIATAAPKDVPRSLIEQLKPGGRMVLPVGPAWRTQMLTLITRRRDGSITRDDIMAVGFVPMVKGNS